VSSSSPQISVVIPCLNEEAAVGAVVDQAWQGIEAAGRRGEVIVVDNGSNDRSAEVAAAHGAIVVEESRRGYGNAYLAGLAHAKGEYIVMGDADGTYPMRELGQFVDALESGSDLVVGSRFNGRIHDDAMPWSHRWIGNPILTKMLGLLFGIRVSDAPRRVAGSQLARHRDGVRVRNGLQGLSTRLARDRDPHRLLPAHG